MSPTFPGPTEKFLDRSMDLLRTNPKKAISVLIAIIVGIFGAGYLAALGASFAPKTSVEATSTTTVPYSDQSQLSPLPPYPPENPYANVPAVNTTIIGTEIAPKVTCNSRSTVCAGIEMNAPMIIEGN
jgi:hypothetical protein